MMFTPLFDGVENLRGKLDDLVFVARRNNAIGIDTSESRTSPSSLREMRLVLNKADCC